MTTKFRMLASVAALSAAVCISSVSFAQEPLSGAATPTASVQHDRRVGRERAHVEDKARALHDILNIRPDQDGAFQALVATMWPPEGKGGMGMHGDQDGMDRMTTPQRLDRMAARMSERQAEFQRHADAVRRFYAALNPDQQRAFDALHGMMMSGDDHGMGRDSMGDHHDREGDNN